MIYWLHDFRFSEYIGGAQVDNEHMLKASPFPVEMVYPNHSRNDVERIPLDRDKLDGHLLIVSNTGLFTWEDLAWVRDTQKYIKYERDYSFCRHRHATDHNCRTECTDTLAFYTGLFQNAVLNLFPSQMQAEVYLKYMPLDQSRIAFIPSPIDVDRFSYDGPKEDFYLAVGADMWVKGTDIIRKEYPNLVFIGDPHQVAYNQIHTWYHRAKYFVHKPRWIDPCPRTVGEALCARCELILNDNIGWLSYPWWGDREASLNEMRNSPKKFWRLVGEHYDS